MGRGQAFFPDDPGYTMPSKNENWSFLRDYHKTPGPAANSPTPPDVSCVEIYFLIILIRVGRLLLERSGVDDLTPLPAICSESPGRVNAGAEGWTSQDTILNHVSQERLPGLLHPAGGLLIAATTTLWWSFSCDFLARWPKS